MLDPKRNNKTVSSLSLAFVLPVPSLLLHTRSVFPVRRIQSRLPHFGHVTQLGAIGSYLHSGQEPISSIYLEVYYWEDSRFAGVSDFGVEVSASSGYFSMILFLS